MDYLPFYASARCLILGVGNILFGDDGFGPRVAQRIEQKGVPAGTAVMDAGTGVRQILFNLLLSDRVPALVIVVDAVDRGRPPGELFWLDINQIPDNKVDDFSMHQAPTSNLLRELRDQRGIVVEVLACQSRWIPREMETGLSPEVSSAIGPACERIHDRIQQCDFM